MIITSMMRHSSYALAGSVCIGLVEAVSMAIFLFDLVLPTAFLCKYASKIIAIEKLCMNVSSSDYGAIELVDC